MNYFLSLLPAFCFFYFLPVSHIITKACLTHTGHFLFFFISFLNRNDIRRFLEEDGWMAGERVDPGLPAPARVLGLIGLGLRICVLN